MSDTDLIVFVDEQGEPTGLTGHKLASHTAHTPRHLAFSCYIFRKSDDMFLMTQRALTKKVWPGVWTNSVCGHPMPDEDMEHAIRRRAEFELGLRHLTDIRCVLPDYKYTTPPYNGIIENEFCPVYVAYSDDEPQPNTEEVEAYKWLDWGAYVWMLQNQSDDMSYWAKDQYKQLQDLDPFAPLLRS